MGVEGLSVLENIVKLKIKRLGPMLGGLARICRMPVDTWREVSPNNINGDRP